MARDRAPEWDDMARNARKKQDDEDEEEERPKKKRKSSNSAAGAVNTVIPFRNIWALSAYYSGILMLIPCIVAGGILGIIPLGLGIFGLVKAAKEKEARGRVHAWIGIGLGAFEILSTCVMGPVVYMWFKGVPLWVVNR